MLDELVCRRPRHIICYWRGDQFVIDNYATGERVSAPPLTANILAFFDDWQPVAAFLATTPKAAHRMLRALLTRLIRCSLLHRSDRAPSPREKAMDAWLPWNPAAGFFHTTTRDTSFMDMDTQVRHLRKRGKSAPMPDPVKRYRGAPAIALPSAEIAHEFPQVLLARRTWRRFSRKPVDLASFGTLLGLTGGIQRWAHARGEGRVALKTSPSGGARHAIELYALAIGIKGLRRGLYHYAADTHALELIRAGAGSRLIERYLPNQPWYKPAAALVFFAPVIDREIWRYAYPRAYRALLIEAGHLCQTFCLTSTWLGLAPFCTMALADSRIENDLGLDGITESVLYVAGIGTRPRDAEPPLPRTSAGKVSMLERRAVRMFPGRIVRPR